MRKTMGDVAEQGFLCSQVCVYIGHRWRHRNNKGPNFVMHAWVLLEDPSFAEKKPPHLQLTYQRVKIKYKINSLFI